MSRTFVALDTETTGLNPERDEIIEIGAVRFRDGQVLDTWSSLVKPRQRLPYKIQLLTGIQPEELEHAPPVSALTESLIHFVGNATLVGHNVRFDLAFLRPHGLLLKNLALDTFELASILVPGATSYSLEDLTQALGIKVETYHRALSDAMACKGLFDALFERALNMDLSVLQEINRAAAKSNWPAKHFFREVERERARTAFTGAVREQLRAKGELDADSMGLVLGRRERFEPLRPVAEKVLLDEDELVAMLEPGGGFATGFPGYEHRPQQIDMMRAVIRAFNEGDQLLAEAGTGTGKSVAYLVPAIHFAIRNGQPIVISTNTINLQDQLFSKDVPDLRKVLSVDFQAALLKGRSNYLCLRRFRAFRRSQSMDITEVQVLAKILAWLPVTQTGDIAELSLRNDEQPIWRRVQAERETCLGDRCSHFRQGRCFFYRARQQAEAAHIIVINHALLLSDMMVDNRVLPEYHHLIVDEAHHLEARATEQLGFGLSRAQGHAVLGSISHALPTGQFRGLLSQIPQHFHGSSVTAEIRDQVRRYLAQLQQQVEQAHTSASAFFDRLHEFVRTNVLPDSARGNNAYDIRIELTDGIRHQPDWSDIEILADDLCSDLQTLAKGLHNLHAGLADLEDQKIVDYDDLLQEVWAAFERVQQMRQQLQAIVVEPDEAGVCWLAVGANDQEVSLNLAPLHVGSILRDSLFPKLETLVMTSATLRTGSDFHYIRERLNVQDADELVAGSPFDYGSSTLLILPTDIPEPGQPNYQNVVSKTAVDLCLATEGRALLLFTSYSQLRATYRAISRPLEEAGIVVYGQGLDGSRRQLLERFKSNPRAVLLGTRSFWEGIDVVGPALSCLVIARLPFSVPTDPVFAARSRAFDDPFVEYAVPEAVLRFRQGFGRLIRSTQDRGVVVVLDRRVMSKRYGSCFLDSLPDCTEYRGPTKDLPAKAVGWIAGSRVEGATLMSESRWRRDDEDWW